LIAFSASNEKQILTKLAEMEDKVLAAIIGAIAGGMSTYLGAILKFRVDLKSQYDKDLRDKRIAQYSDLWRLTGTFPKYARENRLMHQDLQTLMVALREWYFTKGGMFLSDASRDAYFALQEELKSVCDGFQPGSIVEETAYQRLRGKGSAVRSALVRDVGTRKASELN
jgi:hypothetical protein